MTNETNIITGRLELRLPRSHQSYLEDKPRSYLEDQPRKSYLEDKPRRCLRKTQHGEENENGEEATGCTDQPPKKCNQ